MEEIRILIAAESAQTVEALTRLVQFEHDLKVIGSATTGQQALPLVEQLRPAVVLIGRLPDMAGLDAGKAIAEQEVSTQVILLAADPDANLLRLAMKAGIREVLTSPPAADELYSTIREAHAHWLRLQPKTGPLEPAPLAASAGPRGVVLAVCSGKGGVGSTTLATNLAILLHGKESPAVLVDADFQFGDVPVYLNLQARNSIVDLLPFEERSDIEFLFQVLLLHPSGLRVLAAPIFPLEEGPVPAADLKAILDDLSSRFSWVIVDTGSTLEPTTATILERADLILNLLTPDIPSIRRTNSLYELLDMAGVSSKRVAMILNMVEKERGIPARDIQEKLKREIIAELPYDRGAALEAINRGEPLVLNGKTRPFTKALYDLAAKVREMAGGEDSPAT